MESTPSLSCRKSDEKSEKIIIFYVKCNFHPFIASLWRHFCPFLPFWRYFTRKDTSEPSELRWNNINGKRSCRKFVEESEKTVKFFEKRHLSPFVTSLWRNFKRFYGILQLKIIKPVISIVWKWQIPFLACIGYEKSDF